MRAAAGLFLLLALCGLAPAAAAEERQPGTGMLPPEIERQFSPAHFSGFGEAPLWGPEALRGYRTRYRLTIRGILVAAISIRIDQHRGGQLEGHVAYLDRRGSAPHGRTEHRFPVTRTQFEALQAEIGRSRLWTIYPEFWEIRDEGSICLDGMVMVFERHDERGYRFSTANAQCNAPDDIKRVAEAIIEIAGMPQVRHWLG